MPSYKLPTSQVLRQVGIECYTDASENMFYDTPGIYQPW